MSKLATWFGLVAFVVAACSGGDVADTGASPITVATTAGPTTPPETTTAVPVTIHASSTSQGPTVTYDPQVPRYGGVVIIADDQEPPTLNPYAPGGDNFIVGLVSQAHLAGGFDVDPETLELIPELVVELPTVANGGVVVNGDGSMDVSWQVRPEATWSDGEQISGADFAFTLEFVTAIHDACTFAFDPRPLPAYEVLDVADKSIKIRFAAASLSYEQVFRWVVPAHAVSGTDYCEGWTTTPWPAAGPFVVDEWVRDGSDRSIHLSRNDNYWKVAPTGDKLPYLDSVEFRFIPETESLVTAFSARQVDVINPPPFVPDLPVARWREQGADVAIIAGPVWEHFNFQFGPNNRNEQSLNGILEFRQAIAYGLDRRALLDDAGYEWVDVSDGFVGHSTKTASSEPWAQYSYDPQRARDLIAAACAKAARDCIADPPRIIYSTTSNADFRPRIADKLVEQLTAIGVEVEKQLEDSQLFFGDTLNAGSWDMGAWAWVGLPTAGELVDLLRVFVADEPPPDGDNYYRWGAPGSSTERDDAPLQVQQLIAEMRQSADADRVFMLARQVEQILADQVVIIPLNARVVVGAVWADEIQGFHMNPSQAGHTWNIERWYRVGE